MKLWLAGSLRGALALWFGLLMARPETVHRCPMHGPGAAAAASAHDAATHHTMPGHSGKSGGQHCTCPGACCPCCAPAQLQPAVAAWLPVTAQSRERRVAPDRPAIVAADHVLPFATAPPSPSA